MKNENNTQHTPGPWQNGAENPETGSLVITAYNIFSIRYVHFSQPLKKGEAIANARLIASAPDLLKENEQLKRGHSKNLNALANENDNLKALNAELLKALKNLTNKSYQYGFTPYKADLGGRWIKYEQRISEADYNKIESTIAKAEGKTLDVS